VTEPKATKADGKKSDDFAPTLAERLLRAARAMPDVEKTGRNPHFAYAYLEDKEITAAARRALLDNGLLVIQSLEKLEQTNLPKERGVTVHTRASWKFTLIAAGVSDESGQREIPWTSEAMDNGDKGVSKAATGARKDFFRTLLMVPGGAESEADAETDREPAEARATGREGRGVALHTVSFKPTEAPSVAQKSSLRERGFEEGPGGLWVAKMPSAQATKEKERLSQFGEVTIGLPEGA
jgi:hypothetical protein